MDPWPSPRGLPILTGRERQESRNNMHGGRGWVTVPLSAALVWALAQPAGASVLERVLRALDAMGPPLTGVFANVAAQGAPDAARVLRPGDRVIVGYAPGGAAVTALAGPEGLYLDPAQAAGLQTGLAAGLYPPGSALYALPPAGQLSLYQADRDDRALAQAREFLATRVDGSITTVMTGLTLPELALVHAGPGGGPGYDPAGALAGRIEATVLGAVNTGQVVTALAIDVVPQDPGGALFPALAGIAAGASQSVHQAQGEGVSALSARIGQLGGGPEGGVLMLNLAANEAEVLGRIETRISGQSARLGSMVATVLGAVNGGAIGGTEGMPVR